MPIYIVYHKFTDRNGAVTEDEVRYADFREAMSAIEMWLWSGCQQVNIRIEQED